MNRVDRFIILSNERVSWACVKNVVWDCKEINLVDNKSMRIPSYLACGWTQHSPLVMSANSLSMSSVLLRNTLLNVYCGIMGSTETESKNILTMMVACKIIDYCEVFGAFQVHCYLICNVRSQLIYPYNTMYSKANHPFSQP